MGAINGILMGVYAVVLGPHTLWEHQNKWENTVILFVKMHLI